MAENDSSPVTTPVASPAAAPTAITPAPAAAIPTPSGSADYSGLMSELAPLSATLKGEAAGIQESTKPTPPAPPPPHARLLAMVSGLATGLGAAGTAIATRGAEGGVKEVEQVQSEEQNRRIQAQQAQQAQKNQQIQNQLTAYDTNLKLYGTIVQMATLKNEMAKSDTEVAAGKVGLAEQKFNLFANTGLNPQQIDQLTSGGSVDANTSSVLQNSARQSYRLASQLLPADNPALVTLKSALDNNAPVADLVLAGKRLETELNGQEKITDAQIKKAQVVATAPYGDKSATINDSLLERYQVLNPGAKELPAGLSLNPNSTPQDFDRIDKIMQQTENAQATKANRDIVNGMREMTLGLAEGKNVPGDATKTGAEYLSSLPPGIQGTVKAMGEGRQPPPPAGSRSPAAQAILGALNRAYPNYDATQYPTYARMRTEFTSGKTAQGINSFNTVASHLARMYDHTSAVGTLPGVSNIARAFGDKQAAALNADRQAVATELSKAYAAGQISEGEINTWNSKLSVWSPVELRNNIQEVANLLQGKQNAYQTQWQSGMPSGVVAPLPIVSPAAQVAFDQISGKTTGTMPSTSQSANYVRPPTVSSNAKLMQAPGGQPHWIEPQNQKAAQDAGAVDVQ